MVKRYLTDPVRIELARELPAEGETALVRQALYVVPRGYKPAALVRVLDVEVPTAAIVFCRTREEVDQLTATLNGRGYRAEALHGGMDQQQRDRVVGRLRNAAADLVVATDVAARGLDIEQLTHVVNYDVPSSPDSYVHRIGRVGRAGREGTAITLAEPREHRLVKTIERVTKHKLDPRQLPSVEDLRSRRSELMLAALRERLLEGDLDRFRAVVEPLTEEFDTVDIALAAVALAQQANGATAEEEIPEAPLPGSGPAGRGGRDLSMPGRDRRKSRPGTRGMTRLFVGTGRTAGVRPQDLVGAIAGESSLKGRDIGNIEIADRFSLVEVPDAAADHVIAALQGSRIKGRKATVRRERSQAR